MSLTTVARSLPWNAAACVQHLLCHLQQQQQLVSAGGVQLLASQQPQQQQQSQCTLTHQQHPLQLQQQRHQQQPQHHSGFQQQLRHFSSSRGAHDLRDFLDSVDAGNAAHGNSWTAKQLRNKSFDDLHKLWYVCLKERNMLLTQISWEQTEARISQVQSRMEPGYVRRLKRVKKTMNRIKQVLSERACNESDAVKSANMKRVIHYM